MYRRLVATLIIVVCFVAGCQRVSLPQTELPDDGPPIVVSEAAAIRFVEKVTAAGRAAADSGSLTLSITQEEITSFLAIGTRLAERVQDIQTLENLEQLEGVEGVEGFEEFRRLAGEREGLPDLQLPDLSLRLALREPQIFFKDNGQIVIRGFGEVRGRRQPLRIVTAPRAGGGELVLDFVEGTLGPLPVPEAVFDVVGQGLARVILAGQDYGEITEIQVGGGVLTINARRAAG